MVNEYIQSILASFRYGPDAGGLQGTCWPVLVACM